MGFKQKFLMSLRHQLCYRLHLYQNFLGTFMWITAILIFLIYYSRYFPLPLCFLSPAFSVTTNWVSNTQDYLPLLKNAETGRLLSPYSQRFFFQVTQSCLTLCNPMDYTVHGILQARILDWVPFPFPRGSPQSREWTQVSCIAGDSLPAEPPRKSKDTRVGNLSLLQGIFPTQESNQGLLHCGWILYQLSYQGSPLRG